MFKLAGLVVPSLALLAAVRALPPVILEVISDEDNADNFNVLHHLAGDSPYFNSPGVGLTVDVPDGCSVTRATYLFRHTDIFANDFEYENQLAPFLYKLGNFTDRAAFAEGNSPLAFLANWTSPISDPENQIEEVTDSGKRDAQKLGGVIAQRHQALLANSTGEFKFWVSDADRDLDTAHAFVQGFDGKLDNATLVIVEEGEEQGANSLTPHESCPNWDTAVGTPPMKNFLQTYAPAVAARLDGLAAPNFNWTSDDVFAAQSLCGYDTVIRGTESPFCGLFTESEWLAWEYANDLMYHRSMGYGSAIAPTLGIPWLTASARLLTGQANSTSSNSSADTQSLFISFTHREEPPFIVTALGVLNETNATMPEDAINYERAWRTSFILPFLANIALERLDCNATALGANSTSTAFVRALVNAAPLPLPGCSSGPGGSCELQSFSDYIGERAKLFGDFVDVCGIANETNATSTLGIYEGDFPANGAAVETESVTINGTIDTNATNTSVDGTGAAVKLPARAAAGTILAVTLAMAFML
ncbi:phosphoglycerate mutase-like protein [Exidia glandulosa HHB12029]|uniref:Phosphoglycerate mutase-like protein n=1 Tax=Exidia glandulosa HHB12029 TaxID=1314781 RepID=A0A165IE37_EXIGL|nr:phosphoglycerate mutase-like protein [Exidia glandulosa HHB12029]